MDPAITQALVTMAAELLMCPIIVFFVKMYIGKEVDEAKRRRKEAAEWEEKERDKRDAESQMLLAIARTMLLENYERCMDKGYYSVDEREVYNLLWNEYKRDGGNGVIDGIAEPLRNLPTEPPDASE